MERRWAIAEQFSDFSSERATAFFCCCGVIRRRPRFPSMVTYTNEFTSQLYGCKDEACMRFCRFVYWSILLHQHSGIKYVTPHQRQIPSATAICRQRADVYEFLTRAQPARSSRTTCCWRQEAAVWISMPLEQIDLLLALQSINAA